MQLSGRVTLLRIAPSWKIRLLPGPVGMLTINPTPVLVGYGSLWRSFDRREITRKKDRPCH
jgi:hypothetical protein